MSFQRFAFLSVAILGTLLIVLHWPTQGTIFAPLLMVLLASAPILASLLYLSRIRRIHRLSAFSETGTLRRLLSGYWLQFAIQLVISMALATVLVIQSMGLSSSECVLLFALIPVLWSTWWMTGKILAREWKPVYSHQRVLGISCWASALLMVLLSFATSIAGDTTPAYDSFGAAVEYQRALFPAPGPSALLNLLQDSLALWNGLKSYAIYAASGTVERYEATTVHAAFAIGTFAYYAFAATLLGAFLVPPQEYRRVFAPIAEEAGGVPLLAAGRIAMTAAVVMICWLFVYPQLVALLEQLLEDNPTPAATVAVIRTRSVELIDGKDCDPGTIDVLRQAGLQALAEMPGAIPPVEAAITRAFDAMEANVDPFLDWYYSLPAEYGRIAHILAGDLEAELEGRLKQSLDSGGHFAAIQDEIDAQVQRISAAHTQRVRSALAPACRDREPGQAVSIIASAALSDITQLTEPAFLANTRARLGGSSAVGGSAGAVVAAIVAKKVVAKGSMKLAAKAALKAAASKIAGTAGGTAAGATIGGTVGSIVPGVGTAIGAFVGGAIGGIVTAVAVDAALLELDELFVREQFKTEIVQSLHHTRAEFLTTLHSGSVLSQ